MGTQIPNNSFLPPIFDSLWNRGAGTDPPQPHTSPSASSHNKTDSIECAASSSMSMEKLAVARASLQLNLVHNTQIVQVRVMNHYQFIINDSQDEGESQYSSFILLMWPLPLFSSQYLIDNAKWLFEGGSDADDDDDDDTEEEGKTVAAISAARLAPAAKAVVRLQRSASSLDAL